MGLFSKKDKHASTADAQALANPSTANHNHSSKPSNVSNTDQSYKDSTYYSNSNHSSTESRRQTTEAPRNAVPQQRNDHGQAPGTTVTTTTTTTTTTTVVAPDGSTYTYSGPYNPSTDPPPGDSETTLNSQRQNEVARAIAQERPQNQAMPQTEPQRHVQKDSTHTSSDARVASPSRKAVAATPAQLLAVPGTSQDASVSPETPPAVPVKETNTVPIPRPRSEMRNGNKYEMEDTSPIQPPVYPERNSARNSPVEEQFGGTGAAAPAPRSRSRSQGRSYDPRLRTCDPRLPRLQSRDRTSSRDRQRERVGDDNYTTNPPTQAYGHTPTSSMGSTGGFTNAAGGQGYGNAPGVQGYGLEETTSHNTTTQYGQPASANTNTNTPYAQTSETSASKPITSTASPAAKSKQHGISGAFRGIRGASEVLRGTVNQSIAKGMHDKEEEARMRAVRDEGMQEFNESGLRESFGRRERKRSRENVHPGVYGSEGPGGLDAVEERSVRSLENR